MKAVNRVIGVVCLVTGILAVMSFGIGHANAQEIPQALAQECKPAYQTCLPNLAGDALDCGDINRAVILKSVGDDPYGLDRDNDGVGCETNGQDVVGSTVLARTGPDTHIAIVGFGLLAMGSAFLAGSRTASTALLADAATVGSFTWVD